MRFGQVQWIEAQARRMSPPTLHALRSTSSATMAARGGRMMALPPVLGALRSASSVTIDLSNATRHLGRQLREGEPPASDSQQPEAEAAPLLQKLRTQIRVRGPMSIKEFMTSALTHPTHGYYMQRQEVFGHGGDFVTSPELSQIFGELLGIWCVASWERLGKPSRVRLIEAGPGRGTLIADVLRSTAVFPSFHSALSVDLIEVSDHLRSVQRQTVAAAGAAEPIAVEDGQGRYA